jgi:gamma-glutamylcyclotransferase (GGCT)/AIG2-like uncharacterized protein YtfP
MATLFFYGTLRDADVRSHVMGRDAAAVQAARIDGYRARPVAGKHYPVLVSDPVGHAVGVLAHGIDRRQLARLIAYEGGGYSLKNLSVITAAGKRVLAQVFMPRQGVAVERTADWDFEDWRRRWKAKLLSRRPAA